MRKLSISRAWEESVTVLRREGSLLLPVAFAFVALPLILFQVATPTMTPGVAPEPGPWMLLILPLALLTMVGTLSITLLSLRGGISVGEALGIAGRRLLPLIGATIILVLLVGLAMLLVTMVTAVLTVAVGGSEYAAATLALVLMVPLFAFFWTRLMLIAPVAVAETGGPLAMIRRSWALTRGHVWRLLGFVLLVGIVAGVLAFAVTAVLGSIVALLLGAPEPNNLSFVILLLIGGTINAVWGAFYAVLVARIYVQLAAEPTTGI